MDKTYLDSFKETSQLFWVKSKAFLLFMDSTKKK